MLTDDNAEFVGQIAGQDVLKQLEALISVDCSTNEQLLLRVLASGNQYGFIHLEM